MTSSLSLVIISTLVATATSHFLPFPRFPIMRPFMPMAPMMPINPLAHALAYRGAMMAHMGGPMTNPGMANPGVLAVPGGMGAAAMGGNVMGGAAMGSTVMGGMAMGGGAPTIITTGDSPDIMSMPSGSMVGANGGRVVLVSGDSVDRPDINYVVG